MKLNKIADKENCPARGHLCEYHKAFSLKLGIYYNPSMSASALHTARLYIQTVKYIVTNVFYVNFAGVVSGSVWPPGGENQAFTMTGIRRLDNDQILLEDIINRDVKGDFIEVGVWKGGLCIFAAAIFQAYQQYSRKVYLADSFDGIPKSNVKDFPVDAGHVGSENIGILKGSYTGGINRVKEKLQLFFNLQSSRECISTPDSKLKPSEESDQEEREFQPNFEFLHGYFKDTFPLAVKNNQFKCFSMIRLDGDIYESTWQSLMYLYPYLNIGGFVIIDDYITWNGAYKATHDFREKYNIKSPIIQVYHSSGEPMNGVYFMKEDGIKPIGC